MAEFEPMIGNEIFEITMLDKFSCPNSLKKFSQVGKQGNRSAIVWLGGDSFLLDCQDFC